MKRYEHILSRITRQRVSKWASRMKGKDVRKAMESIERFKKLMRKDGPLAAMRGHALLLGNLLRDYAAGRYRTVPFRTIGAAALGILYVVNPMDLIPDFIPIFGQVDDAAVLGLCLSLAKADLDAYAAWRKEQPVAEIER